MRIALLAASVVVLSACSSSSPADLYSGEVYRIATHQLPPEANYGRLRHGVTPYATVPTLIEEEKSYAGRPKLARSSEAIYSGRRLEDILKAVASQAGYTVYVPSTLADRTVDLKSRGTLRQVVARLAAEGQFGYLFDDERKHLTVFRPALDDSAFETPVKPGFYEGQRVNEY